jgi:isocitrate lyase
MWVETGEPNIELARKFAEAIHAKYPGKMLAYNCSPSFNWKRHLNDAQIATFQSELAALGYKFQFITLAGFHALNHSMLNYKKLNLRVKQMVTQRPSTSVKLVLVTLMRSQLRSIQIAPLWL